MIREEIYEPSEDTFLLEESLPKNLKQKKVLEIGCGSGFLSIKCALRGGKVTSVDVNENALKATEKLAKQNNVKINLIKSNLFEKINENFDLIFFNPPYVDCKKEGLKGEIAWVGGEKGREVIDKFLSQFKKHLKKEGACLLLISSINEIKKELIEDNWVVVNKIKLMDDEELFVMKFINK